MTQVKRHHSSSLCHLVHFFFFPASRLTSKSGGESGHGCVHLSEDAPIAGPDGTQKTHKHVFEHFFNYSKFLSHRQLHSQAAVAPTQRHHPRVSGGGEVNPGASHGLQRLVVGLRVTCSHRVHPPPKHLHNNNNNNSQPEFQCSGAPWRRKAMNYT